MTQILRTFLVSAVIAVAGYSILAAGTDDFSALTTETARRVEIRNHPVPLPDVVLETQTGTHISFAGLRGRWLVIDFIYARCPTLCLTLGTDFSRLQKRLAEPIAQNEVTLLSISFDPAFDTPAELASYLERSNDNGHGWFAARPTDAADLRELIQRFGVTVIPDTFGGYTHNAAIYIVNPQGRLVEITDLGDPDRVAQMVLSRVRQ